ncbi:MAG TPA: Bax inhibitor-1/YccA family protein [Tepidisphaeraceae bacterium]|nr:Bax inhibitor-1/YccA family protein [Tepidisphaeraceae bacterium]
MGSYPNPFQPSRPYGLDYEQRLDVGVVTRFFNSVYAWMAAGLALTAAVAWWTSTRPDVMARIGPLIWLLFIVEIVLVMVVAGAVNRISASVATVLFLVFSALNGLTLSGIFLIYAQATIASAFVVAAATFAATSFFGFVTRTDLTRFRSLFFMGLIGLVIASIVSIFWHPTLLVVAINYLGVLLFVGLTAYDTQRLKLIALQTQNNPALAARLSISGALALYLDFLNLFLFILSIMGGNDRRR